MPKNAVDMSVEAFKVRVVELARSVLAGWQLRCRACRAVDTARDDVLARYLLQLERLCHAATPGPWTLEDETDCRVFAPGGELICDCDIVGVDVPVRFMQVDAAFIAAARRAVPALIAEVRALQAQLDHATRGCEVDDD